MFLYTTWKVNCFVPALFRLFQFELHTIRQKKRDFSYIIFSCFVLNQWVRCVFQMRISLMFQCSAFFREGGSSRRKNFYSKQSLQTASATKGNHTLFFLRNIGTVYYFLYIYFSYFITNLYKYYLIKQQLTAIYLPYRKTLPHPLFF